MNAEDPQGSAAESSLLFTVEPEDAGTRLDSYLAAQITRWSRARLQRLIEDEEVLVNGKAAKGSYKVHPGDQIEVELTASPTTAFVAEDIPLNIVYEDEDVIVVNKPAGMVVHPAAGVHSGTLANALAYHFQNLSSRAGASRPGIVHRIDKDTSGLMVVAKNEAAHQNLADQFRARTVLKSYVALVHGVVKPDTAKIEQRIGRDPRNRTRMAVVADGRAAVSLYKVRQRFEAFTLLDVKIASGRTHQIRVHLAWLKHPVVGDEVYGGGRDNTVRDVKLRSQIRKLGRQFLHAEQLGFKHPKTNEQLIFRAELPSELRAFLVELEKL
jgi:23S rRNA pseudouridine1911/1915/1917 synthase